MGKTAWQLKFIQGVVLLFLVAGFYFPLFSFFQGDNPFEPGKPLLDWNYLLSFLNDRWNLHVIWFSFYQAFLSALFSILVGIPGAWIISNYHFPGARLFRILSFLPFILPSILVVLAMVLFFGNNGFVNQGLQWLFQLDEAPIQFLYSIQGIFIAHVFYNFPIAMKTIGDQWSRLSPQYREVAKTLGAGKSKVFFKIHLPLLMPSVLSSFVLIFLLCLNSFAIILVLGGGVRYTNMEVLIYQLARIELDFNGAASLACLQLLISSFFLFSVFRRAGNPLKQRENAKMDLIEELKCRSRSAYFSGIWLLLIVVFAFGPLICIIWDSLRSFENNRWVFTLKWYRQLLADDQSSFPGALWSSLKIGLGSACLSSFFGMGMASIIHQKKNISRRVWEVLALFPVGVSTVIFGVAWYVFYQNSLPDHIPLQTILILIHAVLTFPYWIRVVLPTLDAVPPQWAMASRTLGRTSIDYFFKILLPWLKRVLIIGFFFSFSLSLGELNSTLMIADNSLQTLPLEIYRAISSYRFSSASAMGVVLLMLSVGTFFVIEELLQN
ncbi:MAG: iron ABC transporter permease [SAR324 cluster bacterium]|nr:iron ABC transporter permease [SAR324 cluster bacterium]